MIYITFANTIIWFPATFWFSMCVFVVWKKEVGSEGKTQKNASKGFIPI